MAANAWRIEPQAGLTAYLWSSVENQVMAALKSVPLGQAAGQRQLLALGERRSLLSVAIDLCSPKWPICTIDLTARLLDNRIFSVDGVNKTYFLNSAGMPEIRAYRARLSIGDQ